MLKLFKKDPLKKLDKEYRALLVKARDIQRSGDIVEYSRIIALSEEVLQKIEDLRIKNG
jgi:hypothetical protein